MGRAIVDFCCRDNKLIVELEGGIHEMPSQKEYDRHRFEDLESRGMRVLRFRNEEVLENIDSALQIILMTLQQKPSPLSPSPNLGEGRLKTGVRVESGSDR